MFSVQVLGAMPLWARGPFDNARVSVAPDKHPDLSGEVMLSSHYVIGHPPLDVFASDVYMPKQWMSVSDRAKRQSELIEYVSKPFPTCPWPEGCVYPLMNGYQDHDD